MKNCVFPAEILLPQGVDLTKWAVVACDQYTSEPAYWEDLRAFVGDAPSALDLVLPEIWLKDRPEERIGAVNARMRSDLQKGIFRKLDPGFVLTERTTPSGCRPGLVACVDLEAYSYQMNGGAMIRATEGTVPDRLPPTAAIRREAPLELPHILLLLDDRDRQVLEPLYGERERFEKLYDFELNMGGGHIRGWHIPADRPVREAFEALLDPELLLKKYGSDQPLLLAVGDGNHSLAAAKVCWEEKKKQLSPEEQRRHPARFALCEIVNLHDPAIRFEPIHRVVSGVDSEAFVRCLRERFSEGEREGTLLAGGRELPVFFPASTAEAYRQVQDFVDEWLAARGGEADYVHGSASAREATARLGGVGILMPALAKEDLFPFVIRQGSLPRKTFSMGEAPEKRYYLEARSICQSE